MPTFTPIKFDKYLLLDRIAVGGMAEVYRAKLIGEKGFEKAVVVKKLLPHLIEDQEMETLLIDEARLAALLEHENIVRVQDCGIFEESLFITMEYLFGKDLNQVIQEGLGAKRPMSLANSLHVVIRICDGLAYAHKLTDLEGAPLCIIHRDISPHNVFITWEGQVKLIDFGIAKAANRSTRTRTGIIKGKAAYMAPEQAEGKTIDHRADIFPVGIILYELVTRKKMFAGDTFEVLARVIRAEYTPPEQIVSDLPPALIAVIHKALEKDPEKRYPSCEAMAEDLRACMYELGSRPSPQKMSAYMQSLYGDRYVQEKQEMVAMMKTDISSAVPQADHKSDPGYQPTMAIEAGPTGTVTMQTGPVQTRSIAPTEQLVISEDETPQTLAEEGEGATATLLQPPAAGRRPGIGRRLGIAAGCLLLLATLAGGGLYLKPWYEKRVSVRTHLQDAAASLEAKRLFLPDNNNARYYFQAVLALDPENREAKAGLQEVVQACVQRAETEIARKKLRAARKTIHEGQTIDPDNRRLKELAGKIAALGARQKALAAKKKALESRKRAEAAKKKALEARKRAEAAKKKKALEARKKARAAAKRARAKRQQTAKKKADTPSTVERIDRKVKSVVDKVKGIFE